MFCPFSKVSLFSPFSAQPYSSSFAGEFQSRGKVMELRYLSYPFEDAPNLQRATLYMRVQSMSMTGTID